MVRTSFSSTDYRFYAKQGAGFLAGLLDHTALTCVDLPYRTLADVVACQSNVLM